MFFIGEIKMKHMEKIQELIQHLKQPIPFSQIVSESYELLVSELDTDLLPSIYSQILVDKVVRVYYYSYSELTIYIITSIKNEIPLITGLLIENKLQAYIIN